MPWIKKNIGWIIVVAILAVSFHIGMKKDEAMICQRESHSWCPSE